MSFTVTIDQKVFITALTAIGASIASRSTLPVLANVKLETKADGLYLHTTNLESRSVYRLTDVVEVTEGAITVSYKELVSLVKPLKHQVLTLSQVEDSNTLSIEAHGFSVSLAGIDASEFPAVPTVHKEEVRIPLQVVTLPVETLRKLVNLVAYAASDDLSRPVFTAICVSLKKDVLEMAAADAFRMSIAKETIPGSGSWDFSLLIPAKELNAIVKKMPKSGLVSIVAVSSTHTTISLGDMSLSAYIRLVEGTFPNYQMIVPKETKVNATIDMKGFKTALQSVEKIVKDSSNITRLHLNGDLEIKATRDGMKEPMSVHVDAETTGQEMDILLNWAYINRVLSVNPGKEIQMGFNMPGKGETVSNKPARVTFPSVPGFTAVLMPMHNNR